MNKADIINLIGIIEDNVQNVVLLNDNPVEALESYGFYEKTVGNTTMLAKTTTPRSEALQTSDESIISVYEDDETLITVGVIPQELFKVVLIGEGDGSENATLKKIAEIFGYVLTDADIEANPDFWNDAISSIFEGSVGVTDSNGNFYLDYPTISKAYDTFASLGGASDVTIYTDADGNQLPVSFYDDGLFFTDESRQAQGYKKIVATYPGRNGILYGVNVAKQLQSSDPQWYIGVFIEESLWGVETITIPVQIENTYMDDTTYTYIANLVLSPRIGNPTSDKIVTLGGVKYWWYQNAIPYAMSGALVNNVYPTPYYMPTTQIGQNWYTDFITDLGGFVSASSSGGGSGITLQEIPGVTHPTEGGSFEDTYPTEYANHLTDYDNVYVFIDTTNFPADWWEKWYVNAERKSEEIREGDNPFNPKGYDEGEGVSPGLPDDDGNNTGFTSCYAPSKQAVNLLYYWLWHPVISPGSSSPIDTIKQWFSNPIDSIISLHKIYVTPDLAPDPTTIHVATIDTTIEAPYCTDTHKQINCGTITIPEYFKNALDYEGYTTVTIFLPFIGFKELSPNDVIGKKLTVRYNIDIVTGACLCDIRVVKGNFGCSIAQFAGNCAVQIPTSSAGYGGVISNMTSSIISGAAAIASKNPTMLAGSLISGVTGNHVSFDRGGALTSNIGELSIKKPFVMVKRYQNVTPYKYNELVGYPTSSTIKLSYCRGFTRVRSAKLDSVKATDREKQELETLLKGGIFI